MLQCISHACAGMSVQDLLMLHQVQHRQEHGLHRMTANLVKGGPAHTLLTAAWNWECSYRRLPQTTMQCPQGLSSSSGGDPSCTSPVLIRDLVAGSAASLWSKLLASVVDFAC